jgi:esterase/lipase
MSDLSDLKVTLPELPDDLNELDDLIRIEESKHKDLKPDNEARIVWYGDRKEVTDYALVYIHGFTASQAEGYPTHIEFGKRYGCNVFLSRLYGHGLDDDALSDLTPKKLVESAAYALAIGNKIGKKVILMGTSTGASLSLYLTSIFTDIKGLIIYSPLIEFYDKRVLLLGNPAVNYMMTNILKLKYIYAHINTSDEEKQYWYSHYRIEGVKALKQFVQSTMTPETFQKITLPVFMGYYYKDKQKHDHKVSVPAMLKMFSQLGTPSRFKRKINFQKSGAHVIASSITSNDYYSVMEETFNFTEDILRMKPVLNALDQD